ncbi:MAG TPA: recombinase family protein, partial [Patescibacteria group bacterium]
MGFVFIQMITPNQQENFSKYKYVIYARKSSEESDRQLRSLDDQIKECRQLAMRSGLKVVDVIRESMSAKKPRKRAKFNALLKRIEAKNIDGIIAWAPDRLARNMLEAGMVIDMIDEGKIKDLKFAT